MFTLILVIFIIGYLAIAFEDLIHINKAASALITGVLCWTIYIIYSQNGVPVNTQLLTHLGDIASILFFLLGAMTLVELIDSHNGFDLITGILTTQSKQRLFFIITALAFFLSALLDNLTTAIILISLCRKLIPDKTDRLWFAGMIIIAANAGGAWSPLGDVTSTMLWIGGQLSAGKMVLNLFIPSLIACLIPTIIIGYRFRNQVFNKPATARPSDREQREGRLVLLMAICILLFIPFFKTLTGLPPFMGMLLGLGVMWIFTTLIHKRKDTELAEQFSVSTALQKIDSPSILFFLGILLSVAALESAGILHIMSDHLVSFMGNDYLIGSSLGVLSAVVDNVPLVAAAQGMFDLNTYPKDHTFWQFLALSTGTGGSAIIIGSAAGVAIMGIENIRFGWYLSRITLIALLGFLAALGTFILQHQLFN